MLQQVFQTDPVPMPCKDSIITNTDIFLAELIGEL